MNAQMRYVLLVLAVIVSPPFSNEKYGQATSFSNIKEKITGSSGKPPYMDPIPEEYYIKTNKTEPPNRRANAVFVILARNSDLNGVVSSMKQMEDRFNKKFQYPRVSKLTDAKVEFGVIPREHWVQPDSIDEGRASAAREDMVKNNVIYGGSVPYRNMCRFNSGLLKPYKYYWRVEPDVKFFCDLDYDPFLLMQDQNKVYGFTVSLYEYEATIPTLWDATKEFTNKNADLIPTGNAMSFLSDDGGITYNRFWSNFEIADLDLWRSEAYNKYFDFLDEKGGFYYEVGAFVAVMKYLFSYFISKRWGDAPVHSIGAALFSKKEQIAIDMNPFNIVLKANHTQEGNAGVTSLKISITSGTPALRGMTRCLPEATFVYL
ncbi:hypothetical protein C0993_010003 [Termitomyces sp. T159_Od127]|nr:hypothetical protein C0993_010003 [Termitomyces sp. T159_Od127]